MSTIVRKKFWEYGGIIAGIVLVAFGIGALAMGVAGRHEVRQDIKREYLVGSPDMTPSAIKAEATKAGLDVSKLTIPSMNIAGKSITTGAQSKAFAGYMRIHTFEATGGFTYSQMGRFEALPTAPKAQLAVGGGTDNPQFAVTDPKTKQPVANGKRDIWVTETALTTALNTSFFAERVALFSMVIGFALLLTGIGFLVLAWVGALQRREARSPAPAPGKTVTA
jgi:hypothetical protein